MTKFTRRNFVKRTGAATIGSALGLGLLPSLTRRLHALDSSTLLAQGVEVLYSNKSTTDSWAVQGGTLTITQTITASAALGACVSSLGVTRKRSYHYIRVKNGKTYVGLTSHTDNQYYRCEGGVPVVFYEYHTWPTPVAVADPNNPQDAIGTLYPGGINSNAGKSGAGKAKVFDNTTGTWSEWYEGTDLPYEVICCTL